jgi:hypothetical protein
MIAKKEKGLGILNILMNCVYEWKLRGTTVDGNYCKFFNGYIMHETKNVRQWVHNT